MESRRFNSDQNCSKIEQFAGAPGVRTGLATRGFRCRVAMPDGDAREEAVAQIQAVTAHRASLS